MTTRTLTSTRTNTSKLQNRLAMIASLALAVAMLFAAAAAAQESAQPPAQAEQTAQTSQATQAIAESPAEPQEPVRQIVVSIPDRKLALIEDDEVVKVYTVSVGKPSTPSPAGEFQITNRVVSPTYYHPGVVIPAGPENPLGTRWIGLSKKGFGIHGTNEPRSIGRAASHGCIRMRRADVEDLFARVRPGDTVVIRAERDQLISEIFGDKNDRSERVTVAEAGSAPQAPALTAGN
jgi:lipoprotein-anchoring transpeptidase ErfK/SrfK